MKRNVKLFALVGLAVLAGVILKSDRGHGQGQGSQSPVIIKRVFLKNQTGDFGPVTLFTPTVSGLYRISTYGEMGPPSNGNEVCAALTWTDEFATNTMGPLWYQQFEPGCASYGMNTYGSNVFVIHAIANKPVTFYTYAAGASSMYTFTLTVEQL